MRASLSGGVFFASVPPLPPVFVLSLGPVDPSTRFWSVFQRAESRLGATPDLPRVFLAEYISAIGWLALGAEAGARELRREVENEKMAKT